MKFTLFLHELRRNKLSLIIWSAALAFMLSVCVFIYPEMQSQMGDLSAMFSDMGSFTEAFGMDTLRPSGHFALLACSCTVGYL